MNWGRSTSAVLSLGDIKLLRCLGEEVLLNIRAKVESIGTTRSNIDYLMVTGDERVSSRWYRIRKWLA
jgi:hypothetical protein